MGSEITLTPCCVYTLDANAVIYFIKDEEHAAPRSVQEVWVRHEVALIE
jgi:hypothetical protein